jgi:hypothetical protein
MLAILHLAGTDLSSPESLNRLKCFAAQHELLLIYTPFARAGAALPAMRYAMPRRRIVALAVFDAVTAQDRQLVGQLLDEGSLPLILTRDGHITNPQTWRWLEADAFLRLADGHLHLELAVPPVRSNGVSR